MGLKVPSGTQFRGDVSEKEVGSPEATCNSVTDKGSCNLTDSCLNCIYSKYNWRERLAYFKQLKEQKKGTTMYNEMPTLISGMVLEFNKDHWTPGCYGVVFGGTCCYVRGVDNEIGGTDWLVQGWDGLGPTLRQHIVAVHESSVGCPCDDFLNAIKAGKEPIWQRQEAREMTVEQISKELGYEVKVVTG